MFIKIELVLDQRFVDNAHDLDLSYHDYVQMCHNAYCESEKSRKTMTSFVNGLLSEMASLKSSKQKHPRVTRNKRTRYLTRRVRCVYRPK